MRGCLLHMPLAVSLKKSFPSSTLLPTLLAHIVATPMTLPCTSSGIALPIAAVRFEGTEHLKALCVDNVPHHMLLGIPGTYDAMPNEHFADPIACDGVAFGFWAALVLLSRAYPVLRPFVLQILSRHALSV